MPTLLVSNIQKFQNVNFIAAKLNWLTVTIIYSLCLLLNTFVM